MPLPALHDNPMGQKPETYISRLPFSTARKKYLNMLLNNNADISLEQCSAPKLWKTWLEELTFINTLNKETM